MKKVIITHNSTTKSFECAFNIEDKATREQMQSMMGGYGILRTPSKENGTIYSGPESAINWFTSVFNMYGFEVSGFTIPFF